VYGRLADDERTALRWGGTCRWRALWVPRPPTYWYHIPKSKPPLEYYIPSYLIW